MHGGTGSITAALADDNISVTVDGEVVVGRRRSHRADVSRVECVGRPPHEGEEPPRLHESMQIVPDCYIEETLRNRNKDEIKFPP